MKPRRKGDRADTPAFAKLAGWLTGRDPVFAVISPAARRSKHSSGRKVQRVRIPVLQIVLQLSIRSLRLSERVVAARKVRNHPVYSSIGEMKRTRKHGREHHDFRILSPLCLPFHHVGNLDYKLLTSTFRSALEIVLRPVLHVLA